MFDTFSSVLSTIMHSLGVAFFAITLPVRSFFGHEPSVESVPPPQMVYEWHATSTPAVVVEVEEEPVEEIVPVVPVPEPVKVLPPVPVVVPVVPVPAPVVLPPPSVIEEPEERTVGQTTLVVKSIPLLSGGTVRAGESVPIAYLQIANVGTNGTVLEGFRLTQFGSASEEVVIGFTTVDDKGGSRGSVGGSQGDEVFEDEEGFAPTDAYFAAGQMRLFTIKAVVTRDTASHIGDTLKLDLVGLETDAKVQGMFPIRGTTWTIQ